MFVLGFFEGKKKGGFASKLGGQSVELAEMKENI